MKTLQNLPIGDSSFESIRRNDQLYVDKTRYIFKLVNEGKYYFISRPRRFGKSLTISTLRCLFEGKKDLFKGLWIAENTNWEWKEHPVILIDEYDKPLIDHLGRGREAFEIAKANRDILKYFFGVIKDGEVASALRFVLLTGVSKFSRVSFFSELNNLD